MPPLLLLLHGIPAPVAVVIAEEMRRGPRAPLLPWHPRPRHRRQHSPQLSSTELAPAVSSAPKETSTRPTPGAQFLIVPFTSNERPPPGLAGVSLHVDRRQKTREEYTSLLKFLGVQVVQYSSLGGPIALINFCYAGR